MNERIQQLVEQATTTTVVSVDEHGVAYRKEFDKEKFAELLIRECALTLYKSSVKDKQSGYTHEAKVMELAGDMVKAHFGVE